MRKTGINNEIEMRQKRAVDLEGLQEILSCGRKVATEIGTAAGARIHIGSRRTLWNVDKIQKYLDSISE